MTRNGRAARAITVFASTTALATLLTGCSGSATAAPSRDASASADAVGIWAAAPVEGAAKRDDPNCPAKAGAFTTGTIRNIVHPARGGGRIRIRLSNQFGSVPLQVDAATVAQQTTGAAVAPSTLRSVTFAGTTSVVVPAGDVAVSDWATLAVSTSHNVAVSLHVSGWQGPATFHPFAQQNNYVANGATDQTGRTSGLADSLMNRCWLFLTGIDEQPPASVLGSVVAFGDSITDGQRSAVDGNDRWPDYLARRLARVQGSTLSVVDEGIGGNRLLSAGPTVDAHGVSGLSRFDHDALGQPGVRTVILLEGVNDIGASDSGQTEPVTASALIDGYERIIAQAHAHHVRVVGATLTPFKGAHYWTAQGEQVREQVNDWILTSHAFDATVDFAAAAANPNDPQCYRPAYDSGDHLHPDDAGYAALSRAISIPALLDGMRS